MADSSQVGEARRFASVLCNALDFDEVRSGRVGIIVNELGNNLVKYATGGELVFRGLNAESVRGIEILSIDRGPGLENTDRAMADGFSTGVTPGTGLGAVRRLSDLFDIYSTPRVGTVLFTTIFAKDYSREDRKGFYDVGAVSIPYKGETVCGDGWCVRDDAGRLSVIVVDGLGHGPLAHKAALEAIDVFQSRDATSLDGLMTLIHGRLKSTRGGAVFLVESDSAKNVVFCGVGNIRAIIQSAEKTKSLISQNGTAGLQVRQVKLLSQEWNGDGLLVLHSDGINSRWELGQYPGLMMRHPALAAAVIYRDYNRGNDDTTVVVIGKRK